VGINQARDNVKPARLQNIPPMQKIILIGACPARSSAIQTPRRWGADAQTNLTEM
jgi:hypothetical protein